MSDGPFALGRHEGCGGAVELVEYAAICSKCDTQDWSEDSGPYDEHLLDKTTKPASDEERAKLAREIEESNYGGAQR